MVSTMESDNTSRLVTELIAGFESLEEEYAKLFRRHQAVERKLITAREQYNALAKVCGESALPTPPLSLSSPAALLESDDVVLSAHSLLEQCGDQASLDAARKIRSGSVAAKQFRNQHGLPTEGKGVQIWNGFAAEKCEAQSSVLPSISESPLEQDFTIEGKPSRLGCPFASMANKKLSLHAASVLSRYNTREHGAVSSTSQSSVSRVNGRESLQQRRSRSHRPSFVDPIKAEICGLSDHDGAVAHSERAAVVATENSEAPDVGVCPIRFLDQHSPEEVATYFEKHKHELPRSHEVCVRRYQSNEVQIRELDAKYGNLVSMIKGLGEKHKVMLPEEPDNVDDTADGPDADSSDKVRKWASSVSAQALEIDPVDEAENEERLPHFGRPLRDVRLGESPSRPWGIPVPTRYLEAHDGSDKSSGPAQVVAASEEAVEAKSRNMKTHGSNKQQSPPTRCPFGFDQSAPKQESRAEQEQAKLSASPIMETRASPVFLAPIERDTKLQTLPDVPVDSSRAAMTFSGPVFIGYSVDDAIKILRESGR